MKNTCFNKLWLRNFVKTCLLYQGTCTCLKITPRPRVAHALLPWLQPIPRVSLTTVISLHLRPGVKWGVYLPSSGLPTNQMTAENSITGKDWKEAGTPEVIGLCQPPPLNRLETLEDNRDSMGTCQEFFFPEPGKPVHFAVNLRKRLSMWKCEGQRICDGESSKMHFHFRKHTCLFPARGVDRNRLPCRHFGFNPCEAFSSCWLPCHRQQPYTSLGWLLLSGHYGTDCTCSLCLNSSFSAPQRRNRKSMGSSWWSDMAKMRYFLSHSHKPNVDRDGWVGGRKRLSMARRFGATPLLEANLLWIFKPVSCFTGADMCWMWFAKHTALGRIVSMCLCFAVVMDFTTRPPTSYKRPSTTVRAQISIWYQKHFISKSSL